MIDSVKFPSCFGFSDGEAYPIIMNGNGPFTYAWSDGSSTTRSDASSGVYNLIVTDANGCSGNASTTLSHPSPLIVSLNSKEDVVVLTAIQEAPMLMFPEEAHCIPMIGNLEVAPLEVAKICPIS